LAEVLAEDSTDLLLSAFEVAEEDSGGTGIDHDTCRDKI
jgi:hypothetical protein